MLMRLQFRHRCELTFVIDPQGLVPDFNYAAGPEVAKDSVDVNWRKPQAMSNLLLRYGKLVTIPLFEISMFEPSEQFHQKFRQFASSKTLGYRGCSVI